MASSYEEISKAHREQYGTDVGRYGGPLLVDRYDDRTHFIYELLQNAEDALRRRGPDWKDSSQVRFALTDNRLSVSHNGHPFTEADVRSICSIALSTKGDDAIGKFGIGFKSVYTFTDHPEIHSGDEAFTIVDYVHPHALPRLERQQDETRIILPLRKEDATAKADLTKGLKALGPSVLLFLRHISELSWSIEGGESGVYLRTPPEALAPNVNRIKLIGESSDNVEVDQEWLVFNRDTGKGQLEIAFSLQVDRKDSRQWEIQALASSPLVVFFPTAHQTNLGFLVQGPFLSTPSRDNIRSDSDWNSYLVEETASLLVDALIWLRNNERLSVSVLRCLPLDEDKFLGTMFYPIFNAVKKALLEEPLLPRADGGHICAAQAKLARTQDLRDLLSPAQVSNLFDTEFSAWLTGEITSDKEPEIRKYLMRRDIGVLEVTPEMLLQRINRKFLESQPDEWILRLYGFLSGRQDIAIRRLIDKTPIIRLEDGSHVFFQENGEWNAFLPGDGETGFPTIRRSVCVTSDAINFLSSLGITKPDQVDDVIRNVLTKYQKVDSDGLQVVVPDSLYEADISRILSAFGTDSKAQREKLVATLRVTAFVKAVNAGNGQKSFVTPESTYIATNRLKRLFSGVSGVYIVDDEYTCLRGEEIRELLEACGSLRHPRPVRRSHLGWEERLWLRKQAGHAETSNRNDHIEDWDIEGFDGLISQLQILNHEERTERARLIWESLGDLEERGGRKFFSGLYSWSHRGSYQREFFSAFIRRLIAEPWIPDGDSLVRPEQVVFESLDWKANPFLLSIIDFKPAIIDQLAKEAGIDPAILNLLKKHNITVEDLAARLGIPSLQSTKEIKPSENSNTSESSGNVYDDANDLYGDDMPDVPPSSPYQDGEDNLTGGHGGASTSSGLHPNDGEQGRSSNRTGEGRKGQSHGTASDGEQRRRTPGQPGARPFISYVGAHPSEEEGDPDELDQAMRMQIEEDALTLILTLEPTLLRTPTGNPGYDLYELGEAGLPVKWVEVKAMTGSLENRPVGLSHTQFHFAGQKGEAFWLYVVEHASDSENSRVVKIQNPVAHAKTFTFDRGWLEIAQIVPSLK